MGYIIWFVLLIIVVLIVVLITIKHGGDEPLEHDEMFVDAICSHINYSIRSNYALKKKVELALQKNTEFENKTIRDVIMEIRNIISKCELNLYNVGTDKYGEYKYRPSDKTKLMLFNLKKSKKLSEIRQNQIDYLKYLTDGIRGPEIKDSLVCLYLGDKIPLFTEEAQNKLVTLIKTLVNTYRACL
jgi:hypothetical protein